MGTTAWIDEPCLHNDCLEDGYFPEGLCSPEFCHCDHGRGFLFHCLPGLYYNPVSHVCDWPWNNVNCGDITTVTTTPEQSSTTSTSTYTTTTTNPTPIITTSTTTTTTATSTTTPPPTTTTTTITTTSTPITTTTPQQQ